MTKKVGLITILLIIVIVLIFSFVKTEKVDFKETNIEVKKSNMLTMMLETKDGIYKETIASEWPMEGYVFNENLSRCENGGILSWDDENKKVIMQSNTSDKCYVYFDAKKETLADYIINNVYTEDGVSGLYYHDGIGTYTNADQEAGDNSYRYSGANPNNYVCFGSDAEICPNDNLYRIIGLFDNDSDGVYNIKMIKMKSIGTYYWDSDSVQFNAMTSTSNRKNQIYIIKTNSIIAVPDVGAGGSNDWAKADINYYINHDYFWNNIGNKWQNIINKNLWKVISSKMNNIANVKVKTTYQNEEAISTTYEDEIGLMYVSDYGYAASPENWQTTLNNYNNSININNNWLYLGEDEWTILPIAEGYSSAFIISSYGNISSSYVSSIGYESATRPVFYLKSNVSIKSGIGTISDPYRIVI